MCIKKINRVNTDFILTVTSEMVCSKCVGLSVKVTQLNKQSTMKNTDYSIISTPIAFVFELLFNLVWLKKKKILIFSKDGLHWSKVTEKTFIMLLNISNKKANKQKMLFFWNFYSSKKHRKIWGTTFDDNQKCVLSSKSAYYYDFWRSCDTEDWRNDHRNKLHFDIYSNRK